jgi:peptidoglycan/LPS O-acetylase OafA/YrhL
MTVSTRHDPRLQSLRGLAALMVALGHSFTLPVAGRIEDPGFHLHASNALLAGAELIFQPNTAVIFFYVLSGFVLAESIRSRPAPPALRETAGFVLRRVGRIVPVMWLSLVLAFGVLAIIPHHPFAGATSWFNQHLTGTPITARHLLANFLSIKIDVNSVLWSVQIELWIAPLFPLAVRLSERAGPLTIALVFAALCFLSIALWDKVPNVLTYAYNFWLGMKLPTLMAQRADAKLMGNGIVAVVAMLFLLPIDLGYCTGRLWLPWKFILDSLISAEIIAFVLLRPEDRISRVLHWRPLVTLGDLSYSFYAFHLMLFIGLAAFVLTVLPKSAFEHSGVATAVTAALTLGSITAALVLSALCYATIERRGTELGRRLGSIVERSPLAAVRRSPPRKTAT